VQDDAPCPEASDLLGLLPVARGEISSRARGFPEVDYVNFMTELRKCGGDLS
jgi:hypothetical protein